MEMFRVSVVPVTADGGGEAMGMEMFETRDEADLYVANLLSGTALDAMPVSVMAVVREELCHGQWVTVTRRLIVKEAGA